VEGTPAGHQMLFGLRATGRGAGDRARSTARMRPRLWRGDMMASNWWLLAAFLGGIYLGIALMAVLSLASKASDEVESPPRAPDPTW
jgi:hypothetical protein